MLRTVFSVAIVPIVLSSAPSWKLGPEKRLPAFRNTSSPPGSLVQSWTFAEGVEDWHPRSGTVQLSHEPAIGHTSSGCLRVRGHDEGNWNFVWSPRFEVRAGAAYHVSLWLRVGALEDHPPPTFYFKAQMFAPEGKRGGALINSNRAPATVSAAWKELELTFTVPPTGLDGVALALEKGTQDRVGVSVCIDDVLITEIRPEDIEIRDSDQPGIDAKVYEVEPLGAFTIVDIIIGEKIVKVQVTGQPDFELGSGVRLNFDPLNCHLFDGVSGDIIAHAKH